MTTTDTSEALAAEFALREKRARAVAAVRERLEAARTEAEAQSAAAMTVVAALGARVEQLRQLRDRLEVEHAAALAPTSTVEVAEAALLEATDRSRKSPADDEAASNASAAAQAEAEDRLEEARRVQAKAVRPLALRLELAIEQTGDAERELEAARAAKSEADTAARDACVELLRLRRDAALLAFDEAAVDLFVAGGAQHPKMHVGFGECRDLLAALEQRSPNHDFGFGSLWRAQQMDRVEPALLLDQAAPAATGIAAPARRKSAKLLEA